MLIFCVEVNSKVVNHFYLICVNSCNMKCYWKAKLSLLCTIWQIWFNVSTSSLCRMYVDHCSILTEFISTIHIFKHRIIIIIQVHRMCVIIKSLPYVDRHQIRGGRVLVIYHVVLSYPSAHDMWPFDFNPVTCLIGDLEVCLIGLTG